MAIPDFESGKRYRLRYRTAGTRADREAVAVYVDRSADNSQLFFAGGSVYGGLTLRPRDTEILSAVLTTDRCERPRIVQAFGVKGERERHDYETGDSTSPMQTDPLCMVCGQPKRSAIHG